MSSKYDQELTEVEKSLVDHVDRGTPLDLLFGRPGPVDERTMRSWDSVQTIRSWVIRDILLGRLAEDPDPHGIDLRGARRLDLVNVTSKMAIHFRDCLLDEGIDTSFADLGPLVMTSCRIEHPTTTAFDGEQLRAPILALHGSAITGSGASGALNLREARIGGLLGLDLTRMWNNSGVGVNCAGTQVDGALAMRGSVVVGRGELGAIYLSHAKIKASAEFDGTNLRNDTGPALRAELLQVGGPLNLRHGFAATGSSDRGVVGLHGAQLVALDCTAATLQNDSGPALAAQDAQVAGLVSMRQGFRASGTGEGAVSLPGSRITGEFDCHGGTFDNRSGPGINMRQARIDGSVYLRDGFTATGAGPSGAVCLVDVHIGDMLDCTGATMRNGSGAALYAEGAAITGPALLRNRFTAEGAGEAGAILLAAARIGGSLDIRDATITNPSGPALRGNILKLNGPLLMDEGASLVASDPSGALILTGAYIDSGVQLANAEVRNDRGPALQMHQTRISQSLTLGGGLRVANDGPYATLDMSQVEVSGRFLIVPEFAQHLKSTRATIDVNGFTYAGLPAGISSAEWLELLPTATLQYAAQPYQQLAAAERAAGHDSGVRRVLMAQRRDQIGSGALTGKGERLWAKLSGVTLGYGYQPWRALIALFLVLLISGLAAGFMGDRGGLQKVRTQANAPAEACQLVDRVGFGLDAGAPLITSGARPKCETTGTAWGSTLTISGWVLKVLAWAFATLFIAGFTGAVRKT